MHWPNDDIPRTWKAMEKLVDTGRVRAIGVSNFSVKKLQDLLKYAKVLPAVNQVECNPIWQQHNLREFCKSQHIHLSVSSISLNESFTMNIIILFMELMWIYYFFAIYGVFISVLGPFLDSVLQI